MTPRAGSVLVVTSVFPRWEGDSTPPFVQNQCELMSRAGWSIAVLAPHASGAKFREKVNGVRIYRYPYVLPWGLQQVCYNGGMLVNLKAKPWTKVLLPFLYLAQLFALLIACLCLRPDVLHSHSLLPQGLSACWIGRLLRIPHVTTSHGNDVFGLKTAGLMGRLKRFVVRDADAITVNSSATRTAVMELGANTDTVHLVPAVANEAAVDQALVAQIQAKYPGSKRILFVGRLIEEKGVLELLQAFAVLQQTMPDVQCLLVGEGVLRARLEAMAKELSITASVHFIGWRPREEIPSWMAAADVLVVPSKGLDGWQEAQGLVIVEAMSVGTVVVASRIGGIPDMVSDGETGYLYEPDGEGALVAELRKAISDDDREEIVENQLELYRSKYCGASITERLSCVYLTCLSSDL